MSDSQAKVNGLTADSVQLKAVGLDARTNLDRRRQVISGEEGPNSGAIDLQLGFELIVNFSAVADLELAESKFAEFEILLNGDFIVVSKLDAGRGRGFFNAEAEERISVHGFAD